MGKKKKGLKDLKAFGRRVQEIRESLSLRPEDVSGINKPIKSKRRWLSIERGEVDPPFSVLLDIAETLGISVHELLRKPKS